jgi:hypothetical protein
MSRKQTVPTVALATFAMLIGPWASAQEQHDHDQHQEHRQHGTHVHGIAALNLALEDNEVQIELDSPAANIVGFEHAPSSPDDHAALDKAVATLKAGERLFKFNDEADCRMETASVTSALLDDAHEGHAEEKAGAPAHAEKEEHRHEEHEGEHAKEDEHEGETHSDIEAAYHFECDTPDKLTALTVALFEAFSGMEKIKVQYVIQSKQGATELTAQDHVVEF